MKNIRYELIKMNDGAYVHTARFEPTSEPIGVIQAVHGFSEHIELYREMASFFVENNYIFVIHDLRGFGKMPNKSKEERKSAQGIVTDYNLLLDDVSEIRWKINDWYPNLPVILYGYSLGGNIATNYLLKRNPNKHEKFVLVSPWLRLHEPLTAFEMTKVRLWGMNFSGKTLPTRTDPNKISRSCQATKFEDPYYHSRLSLRLKTQTTDAGEYAIRNAHKIAMPTLLLCAGQDKIVSVRAIHEFNEKSGDNVIFHEYPDAYHALHTDLVKDDFMARVLKFCQTGL